MVPALVLIARAVEEQVYERATSDLAAAGEAVRRLWEAQDEVLVSDARIKAVESRLATPLLEGDTARVRQILTRETAEDRVVLAADTAARSIIGPTLDSATLIRPTLNVATVQGGVYSGSIVTVPEGSSPLRVALWPVVGDSNTIAGIVGVGTRLDAEAAQGIRELTSSEVALVVGDSLIASTLPRRSAEALELSNLGTRLAAGATWTEELADSAYLARAFPLPARGVPAGVLLFRPITQELRIARGILQSLVGIGIATILLALLFAGVFARIVARPAQQLAQAAARLARGDFRAPLPRPSSDELGQLAYAFGEMRQAIAEREGRLRSAQAELIHREKLAAMGRLVAQLSHEINNPIYNIQNCLEALERRGDPNDPNREFLDLAQEELGRMALLTRQLLDQSRPLADAATPLDLNTVVQRVLTLAANELRARGIRSETRLTRALPRVVAHPDAIQQVLANLVTNAMDAMPGGGTLRVGTRADADAVEVVVEDTGTGIPEDQLSHIFEAFYTTKPGVRGIGLGLFVSEGIIRGHRGHLGVESRVGKGSRFTIRLPRQTLDETVSGAERPVSEPVDSLPVPLA